VRRTPPKHLELDEALALLAVVPDEHLGLPLAAMTHGLRRNEVLGLHWELLDWGARTLDLRGQLQWLRGRPRTELGDPSVQVQEQPAAAAVLRLRDPPRPSPCG